MTREPFIDQIRARNRAGYYLCVGLDPDDDLIPSGVSLKDYLINTIDATGPYAACFKPNAAFYEWRNFVMGAGITGQQLFADIVAYIHNRYNIIAVIGDGKRADIGNTNKPYAREFFDWFGVDALTTNPYFGGGALSPFFDWEGRGVIVMCRTSNPESEETQMMPTQVDPPILGQSVVPYYQYVAYRAANFWNEKGNCGLVVGATAPEEAELISQIAPSLFKLVPGIGEQGGQIAEAVRGVYVPDGAAVYNVSRGIGAAWMKGTFKVDDPADYAAAAANSATHYHETLAFTHLQIGRGVQA